MKKTAKMISLLLTAVMALSMVFAGCGSSDGENGGNNASANSNGANSQSGDVSGESGEAPVRTGDGILKIGVENKGYGDKFANKLAEAFEAKTGIPAKVTKSNSSDWMETTLLAGSKNNDIDVFFDITNLAMKNLATAYFVDEVERAYADITDVYDSKLEGYKEDMTVREAVFPYSLDACTWGGEDAGYGDGKQYFVNWATGFEGLVYNKSLFEKYGITVPKTTNEMFAAMDRMKTLAGGSYAKNSDGYEIYPFAYSGKVNYLDYPMLVWWAQYDGIDSFNNGMHGMDVNGNYTAESQKTVGKLSAFSIVSKLLDVDNKYTDPNSSSYSFTDAQVMFLAEQAFMMSTGDWLEREMSTNFSESMEIGFMRIPVNSDIVAQCPSISTDEQLSQVVAYVDGETATKPAFVSDVDLAFVKSARSMYCSEGNQHICYIPAYSDMIPEAKQFIKFMLSKEGQEIMLEYSYGNMAMLNLDVSQFDYYSKLSSLQRSKLEIMQGGDGATFVGKNYVHPMNYAGGLELTYNLMEMSFGVVKSSGAYKTAKEFWESEYERIASKFTSMMAQAGVSN